MMQQWFKDAKLGIFMHWGIYSTSDITESWDFGNGKILYVDYMKQCENFTASKYNPEKWAELFNKSGARYTVLTTKHHDGVALWDTKYSDLNVVKKTPAGRDLIGPYCEAMRKEGLKVGLYFSHTDWSNDDHMSVITDNTLETVREWKKRNFNSVDEWRRAINVPGDKVVKPEQLEAWERFLEFHKGQITELMTNYGTIDLMWFDVMLARNGADYKLPELIKHMYSINPNVIFTRLGESSDFKTPERGIPIQPPEGNWEFCNTTNDSWGYKPSDYNYKSVANIVRMFSECIGMGGNLLLNVGPKEDGTIPKEAEEILLSLGEWIGKNEEGIYSTVQGLPHGHFYGATTLSKDKTSLFLFYFDIPREELIVKGIRNKIKGVTILATGEELKYKKTGGAEWVNVPGLLCIDLPKDKVQPHATVIKVDLEGELDLYTGKGKEIKQN